MEHNIRTRGVSVGEVDAVDVQWHSQVDRPPWVCLPGGMRTGPVLEVGIVVSVVSIGGIIKTPSIVVRTGLVRRTIQSHVHTEARIHRHCTAHHIVGLRRNDWATPGLDFRGPPVSHTP